MVVYLKVVSGEGEEAGESAVGHVNVDVHASRAEQCRVKVLCPLRHGHGSEARRMVQHDRAPVVRSVVIRRVQPHGAPLLLHLLPCLQNVRQVGLQDGVSVLLVESQLEIPVLCSGGGGVAFAGGGYVELRRSEDPLHPHSAVEIDDLLAPIDGQDQFLVLLGFDHFDPPRGRGNLGPQEKGGRLEHLVRGQAVGFFDDDGELRGEAGEEGVEAGGDVGAKGVGDEVDGYGPEEDGGGVQRCGGGENGAGGEGKARRGGFWKDNHLLLRSSSSIF